MAGEREVVVGLLARLKGSAASLDDFRPPQNESSSSPVGRRSPLNQHSSTSNQPLPSATSDPTLSSPSTVYMAQPQQGRRDAVPSVEDADGKPMVQVGDDVEVEVKRKESGKSFPVIAGLNLNDDPPDSEGEDFVVDEEPKCASTQDVLSRVVNDEDKVLDPKPLIRDIDINDAEDKSLKTAKCHPKLKSEYPNESGHDTDADQQYQGVSTSQEEKVSSLKAGLVHIARKMPKNAHIHFILGLMYQRLCQPQKAVLAFEKATEILQQSEEEVSRPELLSHVQIHHAQSLLQGSIGDWTGKDKDLEPQELDELILKLKESVSLDVRQAAVWNVLGQILIRTGRLQSAISVLSALLTIVPDFLDSLCNLGVAHLQCGNWEEAARCFQKLVLKDQNHPGAFINYGASLLCQHGSTIAGAGANGSGGTNATQNAAAVVAQECFAAALRADPKAGHLWVNLADAYHMAGDCRSAGKCLEQACKLEPSRMSTRYAVALHRIKDAERTQDPTQQLPLAANEMASILREGDPAIIEPRIAWAGLAMVHRAQHEIAAGFGHIEMDLKEVEERSLHTLQQAISEDPDDAIHWHQLGLHSLCTLQFQNAQDYLKAAVARRKDCSYAWSNLGISLQLSHEPTLAEAAYERALLLSTVEQSHVTLSNLGNLYRQQKHFDDARKMFAKAIEKYPGYAPAYNNLGLVFVAEDRWADAIDCFTKALVADPLLDAAKSNLIKAVAISKISTVQVTTDAQESIYCAAPSDSHARRNHLQPSPHHISE
ncbi:putative UDP-N-acetylglucosamine--peptide N-acetylglucosaminyltransferase SPINDLY [Nymphaea thermarum]|nr:putative UDP-N-acetylglucosamine--peptide N-acetylglucosaminyltransferase SPINDLY [Nymphaea thermarum]